MKLERMAFVALGSNQGDSRANVEAAIDGLQELSDFPILRSSLWETEPVDCPPGSPRFINAVIGFLPKTTETPETLLEKLQGIEREFGRKAKKAINEPRPLDLDLIAFGREVRNSRGLILPHPRAHLRRFVLEPLNEIAHDLILPGQRKSVAQLLAALPNQGVTKIKT